MGPAVAVVDLHCHTSASFDSLAAAEHVLQAAVARGLTHLAITDHDTIDGALRARDAAPAGLRVLVGQEVRTRQGDLICVFLETPIPAGLPVLEAIQAARDQGALVGMPHPYDRARASLLATGDLAAADVQALAAGVDWVEACNARILREGDNRRAAAFARTHNLPGVSVSDAHSVMEVGLVSTTLLGDPSTPAGLLAALRTPVAGHAPDPGAGYARTLLARLARR